MHPCAPELGRSCSGCSRAYGCGRNYMREHMIDEARIHYAITDTGGDAPNVVQSRAQVLYAIRAPKITQVKELYNRVCNIARGAALMTETTVENTPGSGIFKPDLQQNPGRSHECVSGKTGSDHLH